MHSFEQRIAAWRRELNQHGTLQDWQVDELEDHLLTTLAVAREEFHSEDRAWQAALERTGLTNQIVQEYSKGHVMSPLSKLVGIGLTLSLLWFVSSAGPESVQVLHLPSLMFVSVFIVGGLFASFGPEKVRRALSASLRGTSTIEAAEVASLGEVFRRGYRLAWMSGVVGSLLAVMQGLQALADPAFIGQMVSACLFCLCYGALVAEVFFANAQQWLAARARVGV